MLNNYKKLSTTGVIKQIEFTPPVYDTEYAIRYNASLAGQADELSYLRLGLLLGSLNQSVAKLLDVGYGDGNFLEKSASVIKSCYGYDISPQFPLPQKSNIEPTNSLTGAYYDVITFYNSLEHMPEIDFIKDLQCQFVVITTPWCHYFSDDWFKNWKLRKPEEHAWHFNDETLNRFMRQQGYTVIHYSNAEDSIRGEKLGYANYLTAVFRKG